MKISTFFGTLVVTGLTLASTAMPASANLVTRCIGTGGAVTVPGDLVVPAGESCTLTGTTVEGRVRVNAGADLVVVDATLNGEVVVAPDAYFDATTSAVSGTVTSRGFGIYLDRSTVGDHVRGRAADDASSFTYLYNSSVLGQVDTRSGELLVDSSQVTGSVRGLGTIFVDIKNSTLLGDLVATDNAEGTTVCASEVDGDAQFTGNAGVQVGDGDLLSACADGANYFGGDVEISDNTVGASLNNTIVRGDLSGTGNDPAPTGVGNRVRGASTGQFVDLEPSLPVMARKMTVPTNRADDARATVEQRRTVALQQAAAAGPAQL
ncbi:MAG: hypothetical protein ACTHWA_07860 [Arachnia sp.]